MIQSNCIKSSSSSSNLIKSSSTGALESESLWASRFLQLRSRRYLSSAALRILKVNGRSRYSEIRSSYSGTRAGTGTNSATGTSLTAAGTESLGRDWRDVGFRRVVFDGPTVARRRVFCLVKRLLCFNLPQSHDFILPSYKRCPSIMLHLIYDRL